MKDLCRLFLYGTLLPGLAPAALRGTVSRMSCIGPAIVRGVLYDFGSFPGALLRAGDEGRIDEGVIRGEVFELPATDLVALDEYEGFDREDIAGSLFVRK